MKDNKNYTTNDLWLITFFRAKGLKLLGINRERGTKKVIFIFEEGPERLRLTKEFFDNAPVGILDIRSAMAEVKSAIFNMPQINLKGKARNDKQGTKSILTASMPRGRKSFIRISNH